MFEIATDGQLRMLTIVLRGFWTPQVMVEYTAEVQRVMAGLQRDRGCRYILIDMVDFSIQSAAIAEGHAELLRMVKRLGGIKVAVVIQSALSKMQAVRVAHDTGHLTFASRADAMAWLSSSDPETVS